MAKPNYVYNKLTTSNQNKIKNTKELQLNT